MKKHYNHWHDKLKDSQPTKVYFELVTKSYIPNLTDGSIIFSDEFLHTKSGTKMMYKEETKTFGKAWDWKKLGVHEFKDWNDFEKNINKVIEAFEMQDNSNYPEKL